ncbi:MAG: hypothetical protein Q8N61_00170, partial [bacterium]|nr:hypothetical protein [bacterium]
ISEGLIWLSFRFDASLLNMAMTYVYSFFSHVLWPVFIPFAIGLLETVFWRKKIISGFQAIGIAVGLYFLYFIVGSPIASQVLNKSIVYISPHFYIIAIMAAYFVATIGSPLFSSSRIVNLFGALALLSAVVAYGFYAAIFFSVWCFFAAILSVVVLLYFICVCCIYHYSKHRL